MTTVKTPTETTMDFIQREREKFYEDTKGMTKDEVMAYIRSGAERFQQKMKEVKIEDYDFSFLEKK